MRLKKGRLNQIVKLQKLIILRRKRQVNFICCLKKEEVKATKAVIIDFITLANSNQKECF